MPLKVPVELLKFNHEGSSAPFERYELNESSSPMSTSEKVSEAMVKLKEEESIYCYPSTVI